MFEKAMRDLTIAGAIGASALGLGSAYAQDKVPSGPVEHSTVNEGPLKEGLPSLAEVTFPAVQGNTSPDALDSLSLHLGGKAVPYLQPGMRGAEANILSALMCGVGAAAATGIVGVGIGALFRPSAERGYFAEADRFNQKMNSILGKAVFLAAAVTTGTMIVEFSNLTEVTFSTTISKSYEKDSVRVLEVPELKIPLAVPHGDMEALLQPGREVSVSLLLSSDGSLVRGWYVAPDNAAQH